MNHLREIKNFEVVGGGVHIVRVVEEAYEIAQKEDCIVKFKFNGIPLEVSPNIPEEWVYEEYEKQLFERLEKHKRRQGMKFCIDCKHCVNESLCSIPEYHCHAPQAEELRNPVDGEWPKCDDMRFEHIDFDGNILYNVCGKDANWFELR